MLFMAWFILFLWRFFSKNRFIVRLPPSLSKNTRPRLLFFQIFNLLPALKRISRRRFSLHHRFRLSSNSLIHPALLLLSRILLTTRLLLNLLNRLSRLNLCRSSVPQTALNLLLRFENFLFFLWNVVDGVFELGAEFFHFLFYFFDVGGFVAELVYVRDNGVFVLGEEERMLFLG